jgi:hypothetical protein
VAEQDDGALGGDEAEAGRLMAAIAAVAAVAAVAQYMRKPRFGMRRWSF